MIKCRTPVGELEPADGNIKTLDFSKPQQGEGKGDIFERMMNVNDVIFPRAEFCFSQQSLSILFVFGDQNCLLRFALTSDVEGMLREIRGNQYRQCTGHSLLATGFGIIFA